MAFQRFSLHFVAFFDQTLSEYGLQKAPCLKKKYLESQKNLFLR
jgi:hypothetical protein